MRVELPRHFDAPVDGRFVVEHPVGEGAAGLVYRAFDLSTKRTIALKVFHVRAMEEADLERVLELALAEAELLRRIRHPGIVELIDAGLSPQLQRPYLALEWIDGLELNRHHSTSPLSVTQIIGIFVLVSRALAVLHQEDIIHQDVKPSNIMLRRRPPSGQLLPELEFEPVLIDFSIATRGRTTAQGGTPAYMSPEQARSEGPVDHRTDIYSLGASLFDLFVGRPPHQGASPLATLARLATTPAPRVSTFRSDVPARLDDVIDGLLQTQPEDRPQSMKVVAELLLRCLDSSSRETFPPAEASSRLGTGVTRLVTTVFAVGLSSNQRTLSMVRLRERGGLAVALGEDALVAHFGVERATGGEARAGLEQGLWLSRNGAAVGIASGRARLQSGDKGKVRPVGDVVDRAATLAREAHQGDVIADASTSELGRGRFEFRVRGDGSAIVGPQLRPMSEQLGGAPFVGRDAELAQIISAYDRVRSDHHSMIVTLSGPPGIGKSRLQREAIARVSSLADPPHVVVQRSEAYGKSHILGAAADILRSLIELPKVVDDSAVVDAIEERLGPETMSELSRENQLLLARLLGGASNQEGADSTSSRDALWLAMTDLVVRILSNEPIVLVAEDLQWADAESQAWIDHLLGRSSRFPLFVLACVRPHFWDEQSTRFTHRDHLRIDLRPISPQAVRAIAQAVLGYKATAEHLDGISFQAGGSPLFAEELARLTAGGKKATQAPTIEAAIQASLDALDADAREAVQRLSVLGQSCWKEALPALGQPDHDRVMRQLIAADILMERSSSRFAGTNEFAFKHALVRDVAYGSLSPELCSTLHAAAGQWLATIGEDAATVAGHLDMGNQQALAAAHWERAAQRALSANALGDAVHMAERALDFADNDKDSFRRASYLDEAYSRMDPRAADRETAISAMENTAHDEASRLHAEGARARYDDARGMGVDVSSRLARVLSAAEQIGLYDEVARCSATLAYRCAFAGDFRTAEQEVKRLLDLSVHRLHGAKVDAYQALAIIRQTKGAVSASLDARKSAAQAAREAGLKERESMLTTNLGFALSTVGARKEARETLERGMILAENIGSPGAMRHAQMNLLGWAGLYGTDRRLDTFLGDARSEADAAATGYWAAPDRSNLGMLYYRGVELLRSSTDASRHRALMLLKMSAESYRDTGQRDVLPVALGMWAEAERVCGNPQAAARLGNEAAELLLSGAPSLLNESPVFLTLYKARLDLGDEVGARAALSQSIHPLLRRLNGLMGSPYAQSFLTQLPQNAELVTAAEAAGLLPESINRVLTQASGV